MVSDVYLLGSCRTFIRTVNDQVGLVCTQVRVGVERTLGQPFVGSGQLVELDGGIGGEGCFQIGFFHLFRCRSPKSTDFTALCQRQFLDREV